jgi:hypothetical protein
MNEIKNIVSDIKKGNIKPTYLYNRAHHPLKNK